MQPRHQAPIRAELVGNDTAIALGLTASASAPVLRLCALLVEAGHDPATRLEVYRGDTLCLSVRSIGDGARLRPAPHGVGFIRLQEGTGEPYSDQTGGVGRRPPSARKAVESIATDGSERETV